VSPVSPPPLHPAPGENRLPPTHRRRDWAAVGGNGGGGGGGDPLPTTTAGVRLDRLLARLALSALTPADMGALHAFLASRAVDCAANRPAGVEGGGLRLLWEGGGGARPGGRPGRHPSRGRGHGRHRRHGGRQGGGR